MAENEGIVSMESTEGAVSEFTDDITDEHGNLLNADGKRLEPDEGEDPPEDEQADPEEGDEDDAETDPEDDDEDAEVDDRKGMSKKAYQRFKTVNDKLTTLQAQLGDRDLSTLTRSAEAFEQLANDPAFKEFFGKQMTGESTKAEEPPPSLDSLDFENMTDAQIGDVISQNAAAAIKPEMDALKQQLQALTQNLDGVTGKLSDREIKGQLSDKVKYPGADKAEKAIKNLMQHNGLTFEQAYFAAVGRGLLKTGKQAGHERAAAKRKKQVHVAGKGKGKPSAGRTKHKNVLEAMRAVAERQGVDFEL